MQRILPGLDGLSLRVDHGLKSYIKLSGLANQNIQSNENCETPSAFAQCSIKTLDRAANDLVSFFLEWLTGALKKQDQLCMMMKGVE